MDGYLRTCLVVILFSCANLIGCGGKASRPVEEISAATSLPDAAPITVAENDWPWWRGIHQNNIAACDTAATTWSETENVVWKTKISGRGHSSPCIVGDRIYLTTAEEAAEKQLVVCLNRTTVEHRSPFWRVRFTQRNAPQEHACEWFCRMRRTSLVHRISELRKHHRNKLKP